MLLIVEYSPSLSQILPSVTVSVNHLRLPRKKTDHYYCGNIRVLHYACVSGDLPLVKYVAKRAPIPYRPCISNALTNGHIEIVKFLVGMLDEPVLLHDTALECACESGDPEIVQYVINHGATNWYLGLIGACRGGHIELVEDILKKVPRDSDSEDCDPDYYMRLAFYAACLGGHFRIVEILMREGVTDYDYDPASYGNIDIQHYLFKQYCLFKQLSGSTPSLRSSPNV